MYSCTSDITKNYNTFKDLCESSGGQVIEGGSCKCPRDGACTKGVTCINGVCANNICSATEEGSTRCTNDDNNVGQMQKCQNNQWIPDNLPSCNGYSCNEAGTKCSECHKDQTSCEDKDGKSVRKRCAAGAWMEVECPNVSCNPDKADCGECKNGEQRCANGKIEECKSGSWNFVNDCPSKECLQDGKECSECTSGTTQCIQGKSGQNAQYDTCIFGQWAKIMQNCDSPECKDTKCAVLNCNDTYEDKCMGNTISTCKDGQVETNVCKSEYGDADCKNDTECGECKDGTTKCINNELYTCSNAVWPTESTTKCHCNDEMTACHPCSEKDYTQCSNNAQVTCMDNLVWSAPEDCGEGKRCSNGVCINSDPSVCKENQKKCEGEKQFKTCTDGVWNAPVDCGEGKKCSDGVCVDSGTSECSKGEKQCIEGTNLFKECGADDKWVSTNCPDGTKCSNGECECIDEEKKCSSKKLMKCEKNKGITLQEECQFGCDMTQNQCYECDPKAHPECNDDGGLNKCEGGYIKTTPCPNGCVNTPNGDDYCSKCKYNDKLWKDKNKVCICDEKGNKICDNWLCYKNEACDINSCGNYLCINNKILSCENEKPEKPKEDKCTPSQQEMCPDKKCYCTNGDIICEDTTYTSIGGNNKTTGVHYRCKEGQWEALAYCLMNNYSTPSECRNSDLSNKQCGCDIFCKDIDESNDQETSRYILKHYKCNNRGSFEVTISTVLNTTTEKPILDFFGTTSDEFIPKCNDIEKYIDI